MESVNTLSVTMKLKYFLIVCLMSFFTVDATGENVVFRAVDSETGQPIEGVTGMVYDENDNMLCEAKGDADGYIRFDHLKKKSAYRFELSISNTPQYILHIPSLVGDFDGGTVKLNRIQNLEEVVVSADAFTQNARMIVAIPSKSDIKSSMNIMDLLNLVNLPGINVNLSSQSATCYDKSLVYKVNGVPKTIDYVKTLNPDRILKFEYQDNPTEKYIGNPDIGGVINIIVRERTDGGSVYAYGSFCPWLPASFINGNAAFSYNYKNSQFEVGYNNDTRDYDKVLYDFQKTYSDPKTGYHLQENFNSDNSLMRYIANNISATYTFFNPKSDILFEASFGMMLFKKHNTLNGWAILTNSAPFYRNQDLQDNRRSPSLDCYFKKGWAGSKNLELNYVASLSYLEYRRNLHDHREVDPFLLSNTVSNHFFGSILEACYNMPIDRVQFSAGIKDSFSNAQNVYSDSEKTELKENALNVYASAYWRHKAFSVYVIENGIFNHADFGGRTNNYWRNTSAVQFNLMIKRDWNINGYLNYSPYSPSLSQLSTVKVENNEYVVTTGNPNLKLSHSLYSRIRVSWQHKNIASYLTITDSYVNNIITSTYRYAGNGNFIDTYENFHAINSIEVSANFTIRQLFNHWDINVYGGYLYSRANNANFYHSMADWFVGGSVTFRTGPFTLYAFASTPRHQMSPYMEYENNPENGVTVMYNWKNFQFGFSLYNLYGKYKAWYSEKWDVNPLISQHFLQRMSQSFCIGALKVTYKLNFGKAYKSKEKGLNNKASDNSVIMAN